MITQEQIDHFNTKGYLVVENLLDVFPYEHTLC